VRMGVALSGQEWGLFGTHYKNSDTTSITPNGGISGAETTPSTQGSCSGSGARKPLLEGVGFARRPPGQEKNVKRTCHESGQV